MSEYVVKAAVRKRDGYRCRDCGITEEEHLEEYGTHLNVHRLFPGSVYKEEICVTLCHDCHGRKPRLVKETVFGKPEKTGVDIFFFNLYDPLQTHIYEALKQRACESGVTVDELIFQILADHVAKLLPDYSI